MSIDKILSEIPESEKTPLVLMLIEIIKNQAKEIAELKAEIARLKGNPIKPKLKPSTTSKIDKKKNKESKTSKTENSKKKNPKKKQQKKKENLIVHNTENIPSENIPKGSKFAFTESKIVQDIIIQANNTEYRREVWKTPDGTLIRPDWPSHIDGDFGATLKSYILYFYYRCNMTKPVILDFCEEHNIDISSGTITNILIKKKEPFHYEMDMVLKTTLKHGTFVVTDDTGLRFKGQNAFSTHIGNSYMDYFKSTNQKNRINFFEILLDGDIQYNLNGFAIDYIKQQNLSHQTKKLLLSSRGKHFRNKDDWLEYLKLLGIKDDYGIRKATEGALLGELKTRINPNLIIVSDDAGQFDVLRHALCWVHSERVITSINTVSYEQEQTVNKVLNEFWDFFRSLHDYKNEPTNEKRKKIGKDFDELFSKKTNFPSLNKALKSLLDKKSELLLVLEEPIIPLTNNISEKSIRAMVKMRKISAGTRSEDGRKSRDTFMGIQKTCKKLEISFLKYLKDRFSKENKNPQISELILQKMNLAAP